MSNKLMWLGIWAKSAHANSSHDHTEIFIDEMETIEHTKLKPVTIALAVSKDYKILATRVGRLPAKGRLAEVSRKKYGRRACERSKTVSQLLLDVQSTLKTAPKVIYTDEFPLYVSLIARQFPETTHQAFLGKKKKEKAREALYETLQKKRYDPLFAINQRCAMFRACLKRLVRRSWCTTKSLEWLDLHLSVLTAYLNKYPLPEHL